MNRKRLLLRRIQFCQRLGTRAQRAINWLAVLRFIVFALTLVSITIAVDGAFRALGVLGTLVFLAVFLALMMRHDRLFRFQEKCDTISKLSQDDIHRLECRPGEISQHQSVSFPEDHPFAADLDFTGHHGLLRILDNTNLPKSKKFLESWLQDDATPEDIKTRQESIAFLTSETRFRLRLSLLAKNLATTQLSIDAIQPWLKSPQVITVRPFVLWPVGLLTVASLCALFARFVFNATWIPWLGILGFQLLVFFVLNQMHKRFIHGFQKHVRGLTLLKPTLHLFLNKRIEAPRLNMLQEKLRKSGASDGLRLLDKIIGALEQRNNGLAHLLLNVLFQWDLFHTYRLDRWRSKFGKNLPEWLDIVAELEATSSLANYAWINPTFSYPEFHTETPIFFQARELGHPLIIGEKRVTNDYSISGKGNVHLLTGSNMSGKSTFLRTIGVNWILARTGAPVCAASLTCSLPELWTSIRIEDSLVEGVSYFLAEVRRVRQILNRIDANDHAVFFLLDEIFKGTNSRERLIASKALIEKLRDSESCGVISTHDLELLALADLFPNQISNYHFCESVDEGAMTFDYTLRKGQLTTTNALRVMELEGLPLNLTDAE